MEKDKISAIFENAFKHHLNTLKQLEYSFSKADVLMEQLKEMCEDTYIIHKEKIIKSKLDMISKIKKDFFKFFDEIHDKVGDTLSKNFKHIYEYAFDGIVDDFIESGNVVESYMKCKDIFLNIIETNSKDIFLEDISYKYKRVKLEDLSKSELDALLNKAIDEKNIRLMDKISKLL